MREFLCAREANDGRLYVWICMHVRVCVLCVCVCVFVRVCVQSLVTMQ